MYVKFEGGISREVILKNKAKKKKKIPHRFGVPFYILLFQK